MIVVITTFETREDVDKAKTDGLSVCATLRPDGSPLYFLVQEDATPEVVRRAAFEAVNERQLSTYEDSLLKIVEAKRD